MRLALGMIDLSEENLKFARQIGVTDIILGGVNVRVDDVPFFDFMHLIRARTTVEATGLRLAAIQNLPHEWYEKIIFGEQGRDEQIENFCRSIVNVGKAGIPILTYNFHPVQVWRTGRTSLDRGGAAVTSYDHGLMKDAPLLAKREIDEDELWDNFTYFLEKVMPIAEKAGVKLALHPDDPPISPIGGAAHLFVSNESFKRAIELVPSESNGLLFCQGCFAEMGTDVYESIRYFGTRKKIFVVHFRNIVGSVPRFREVFIDNGDVDMYKAIQTYKEVGYDGPIDLDHVAGIAGDTPYAHRYRAFAVGYIRALFQAAGVQPLRSE